MIWLVILFLGIFLGYLINYLFRFIKRNKEESDERRRNYFKKFQENNQQINENINYNREWLPNRRGMLLFRQQFIPKTYIRGIIGLCHGFGDHSQEFLIDLAIKFCHSGYAVISMDVEGHGLSDGLHGHVNSMNDLVEDYADYFNNQMEREIFNKKPFFLFGESMGGAIVFNLCTKSTLKVTINGAILVAPMVGIADEMKLPLPIINFFRLLSYYIPLAPITPVPDIVDKCFKDPNTLKRAKEDSLGYQQKPRLGAALVMLETTEDITNRLEHLKTPVLILHGDDDVITCPQISKKLHDTCQSKDKKLIIYPKGCHGLLRGEYPDRIEEIYNDVEKWLFERSKPSN